MAAKPIEEQAEGKGGKGEVVESTAGQVSESIEK